MLLTITAALLNVTFFPYIYLPRPYIRLPIVKSGFRCVNLPDKAVLTITIDTAGRAYYSHSDPAVQAAAICAMAARYGIRFSPAQLAELRKLPYLGLDVRLLPAYLTAPTRQQLLLSGIPNAATNDQLTECILTARATSIRMLNSAPYINLEADGRTRAADIKRFTRTLQQQCLNRFYIRHLYY